MAREAAHTPSHRHHGRPDGAWIARPIEVDHLVEVSGYSYPSGHSLAAAALYLTIAIAIKLKGLWLCLRREIQEMLRQGGNGAIVNMSSVAGLVGFENLPALRGEQARRHRSPAASFVTGQALAIDGGLVAR